MMLDVGVGLGVGSLDFGNLDNGNLNFRIWIL